MVPHGSMPPIDAGLSAGYHGLRRGARPTGSAIQSAPGANSRRTCFRKERSLAVGMIRSSFRRNSISHNRAAGPKVLLCALALSAGTAFGQGHTLWQDGGVQLCGTSAWKPMTAMSDGVGGLTAVWTDARDGWSYYATYTQRVDAAGVPQWTQNGVLLGDSMDMGLVAGTNDGRHGAIVVTSGGDNAFTAQRVGAAGVLLWGPDGLMLRPPADSVGVWPALVGDGHGGVIVVWSTQSVYIQVDTLVACRVDSGGNKMWEAVIRINKLSGGPLLCPDGLGGVIIAWSENYGGPVRAQRVDSAGAVKWEPGGVLACTLSTALTARACAAVGESCFIVGHYVHSGNIWQIRAQMFDLAGNRLWGPDGELVTGTNDSARGGIGLSAGDHRQSVWLWSENRAGITELFAQKLDSAGNRCWDTTGLWLGTVNTSGGQLTATDDGRGGAIAAWTLYRSSQNWDISAQHVDSAGHVRWSDTGLAVCRDTDSVSWPIAVSDGDGGAIITWLDDRGLYAQRVADGAGIAEAMNDERGVMNPGPTVARGVLVLGGVDSRQNAAYRAEMLDALGRKVLSLGAGPNDVRHLPPGVYFVREEPQARSRKLRAVRRVVVVK